MVVRRKEVKAAASGAEKAIEVRSMSCLPLVDWKGTSSISVVALAIPWSDKIVEFVV